MKDDFDRRVMWHLPPKQHREYSLIPGPEGTALLCHHCQFLTHNHNDVRNHYCPHCHVFLDDPTPW